MMKNIPHIGIYSFNYEFMPIISYFKTATVENWKATVPKCARSAIGKLLDDQKLEIDQ
jgi:D-mannonate dehydratase